jgi:formylglycine-generating enzyme required for sulfatase activity
VKQYSFIMLTVVFFHLSANSIAADQQLAGEFIDIPEGIFLMGDSSGEGGDDEKPAHRVKIKPFRLAKHEVTFAQMVAVMTTDRMMKTGAEVINR